MPTSLERTSLTHTPQVQRYLRTAERRWPEVQGNPRLLMLALLDEGDRAVRAQELVAAYEDAFAEWDGSEDAALWDSVNGDGLDDETR